MACLTSVSVAYADATRPVDAAKVRVEQSAVDQTPKIVGGDKAPPGKYPFQVALIASNAGQGFEHFGQFCGGSLIDTDVVLTAAHCVPNTQPSEVDIVLGTNRLGSSGQSFGFRMHLDKIEPHPQYNHITKDNDIALLKIRGPIREEVRRLRKAIPATPAHDAAHGAQGGDAVVIGWGDTSEGGSPTPELMRVWLDIQSNAQCETNYQQHFPGITITHNMLCAGLAGGGKDSCQGDSGGFLGAPLGNGEYAQLGVVSWGVGCARPDLFGVYARVARYEQWITDTMENF
ncbi:MAG: serine protease [Pseudomonadota bacterium]